MLMLENLCRHTAEAEKFNIQPKDDNRSDLGVLLVSDGGLAQPCLLLASEA